MERNTEIINELNNLSGLLAKAPVTMPYIVPESYFQVLSENIASHAQQASSLNTSAPAYEVPSNYFEDLPQQVLAKAKQDEVNDIIYKRPKQKYSQVKIAIAALVILFISIGTYPLWYQPTMTIEQQLADIPTEDLNEYIAANIEGYTLETFETTLPVEDMSLPTDNINTEDITKYLDYTGSDYENIN